MTSFTPSLRASTWPRKPDLMRPWRDAEEPDNVFFVANTTDLKKAWEFKSATVDVGHRRMHRGLAKDCDRSRG